MTTWTCCNRGCVLLAVDDAETPFAQHPNIEIADGVVTWTPSPSPASASGFRVTIQGTNLLRAGITLAPFTSVVESPFSLSWAAADGPELLYLGEVPIAAAPALAFSSILDRIEIGFGWYPYARSPLAVAWFFAYDSDGRLIRDIRVPIPLDSAYITWHFLAARASDDADRFVLEEIGGPAAVYCTPPPAPNCHSFRTGAESNSNYIVRGIPLGRQYFVPGQPNYHVSRLRAETVIRAADAADLIASLFFGDCCASWQFELLLQTSVPAVYLRFLCAHGGPILYATLSLSGANFRDSESPTDYIFAACIRQERYWDGEENIVCQTDVGVYVTDSDGRTFTPSAVGLWGIIPHTPCAFDQNGLVPHFPIAAVTGGWTTRGIFAGVVLDGCPCEITRLGATNECLADICLGGYHPPESPPPTPPEWTLTLDGLPTQYAFAAQPAADGPGRNIACGEITTTESTSAEGNEYDPQNAGRAPWLTQAMDAYINAKLGIPPPSAEVYCTSPCWGATFPGWHASPKSTLAARIWKPIVHSGTYTAAAKIPLFLLLHARREARTQLPSGQYATMVETTTALLGAVSDYPNCSRTITFEFLAQTHKVECWTNQIVECSETPDPPNFSGTTAQLKPVPAP